MASQNEHKDELIEIIHELIDLIEYLTHNYNGCIYIGIRGDVDLTNEVQPTLSKAKKLLIASI